MTNCFGVALLALLFAAFWDATRAQNCPQCPGSSIKKQMHLIQGSTCTEGCFALQSRQLKNGYQCGPCPGSNNSTNPIRSCPDDSGSGPGYQICLDLEVDAQYKDDFFSAEQTWSSKITGDLTDESTIGLVPKSDCAGGYPTRIDDLYVCITKGTIDGPGGVYAASGPILLRSTGQGRGLPFTGQVTMDSADLASLQADGSLSSVITHEFGHVLGVGLLWQSQGVTGSGPTCPYVGTNGNREWHTLSGCTTAVPTYQDGGQGSKCVHFDETCLGQEIMTPYTLGLPLIFSTITLGSLQDLGYQVTGYNDPSVTGYTRSNIDPSCRCGRRLGEDGSSHLSKRRQLSEEGRAIAEAFGKSLLAKASERATAEGVSDGAHFVGGDLIMVSYMEEGERYSVLVTSDD